MYDRIPLPPMPRWLDSLDRLERGRRRSLTMVPHRSDRRDARRHQSWALGETIIFPDNTTQHITVTAANGGAFDLNEFVDHLTIQKDQNTGNGLVGVDHYRCRQPWVSDPAGGYGLIAGAICRSLSSWHTVDGRNSPDLEFDPDIDFAETCWRMSQHVWLLWSGTT